MKLRGWRGGAKGDGPTPHRRDVTEEGGVPPHRGEKHSGAASKADHECRRDQQEDTEFHAVGGAEEAAPLPRPRPAGGYALTLYGELVPIPSGGFSPVDEARHYPLTPRSPLIL